MCSRNLWPYMSSHSEAECGSHRAALRSLKVDSGSLSWRCWRRQVPETPTCWCLQIQHLSTPSGYSRSWPRSEETCNHSGVEDRPVLRILSASAAEASSTNRLWRWVHVCFLWEVIKLWMPLPALEGSFSFREFTQMCPGEHGEQNGHRLVCSRDRTGWTGKSKGLREGPAVWSSEVMTWIALAALASPPPSLEAFRRSRTQLCLIQLFHPSQPWTPKSTRASDSIPWVHPLLCSSK